MIPKAPCPSSAPSVCTHPFSEVMVRAMMMMMVGYCDVSCGGESVSDGDNVKGRGGFCFLPGFAFVVWFSEAGCFLSHHLPV